MTELNKLEAILTGLIRPIAKTRPGELPRSEQNAAALERFRAAVDFLLASGASWRSIARTSGCTVTLVQSVYAGHRYVPTWLLDSLPMPAQHEIERVRLGQLRRAAG
jgi:hypothetical protein